METSLALAGNRELSPTIWKMIVEMAPMMHRARLFGVSSEEQAAAIMLKGYELGLGFTASFEFVQVIMGKPNLIPRGALALLHANPMITKLVITRLTDASGKFTGYSCTMGRSSGFEYTASWTLEQANKAGLVKPDSGWVNYPENMCLWRAVGFAADVVAPDITAGMTGLMKMPERFGVALSEGGDVIEGTVVQNAPVESQASPTAPAFTLDNLLDLFGPEAILDANGGIMPNDEQLQMVAMKLAGGG
jgi:hypothetical protein